MKASAKIIGTAKGPSGMVHHLTDKIRSGRLLTLCGQYVENGWGSPRKGRDSVECRRCIRLDPRSAVAS